MRAAEVALTVHLMDRPPRGGVSHRLPRGHSLIRVLELGADSHDSVWNSDDLVRQRWYCR